MKPFRYQLVENIGHLEFKHKWHNVLLQTFGHEALFSATDLSKTSHCCVFHIDIYRIHRIPFHFFALRKVLNPFKWLDFAITATTEMTFWALQRLIMKEIDFFEDCDETPLTKFLSILIVFTGFPVLIATPFVENILLALPRYVLSPVRYIIRPSIDTALEQRHNFKIMVGITLGVTAIAAATASFLSVASLGTIIASTAAISWVSLLKLRALVFDLQNTLFCYNRFRTKEQGVEQFIEGSTHRITSTFHALNPATTQINPVSEQTIGQTLALFTGTESLFYHKKDNKPAGVSQYISYDDLEDYKRPIPGG